MANEEGPTVVDGVDTCLIPVFDRVGSSVAHAVNSSRAHLAATALEFGGDH